VLLAYSLTAGAYPVTLRAASITFDSLIGCYSEVIKSLI
jgi:hypothetical protein